jgi:hypothetical protein
MRVVEQDDEIEAMIARTALKYDLLPYESRAFPQSHPSRIGAIAQLFGLAAAPLETARVLELGCASGGNIIPHALAHPNARFVGVDLARTQVAAGRARIAKLGLTNIEIHCQSFTELGDELGSFDYILCHGVYSWVPAAVQDAILRIIRARLSPVGLAYVSYNVLPGWRMFQPLRDAFLLQVADQIDSLGRVAEARELLGFLAHATPDKGPYGDMLRSWSERLAGLPDDYIAHEFLEETNQPTTVRDFNASAKRNGLTFLAECDLASMIADNYGAEVAGQVRARSNNDIVETEQYLDLLTGRTFRQSLLLASERQADLNRVLQPEKILPFHFLVQSGTRLEQKGDQFVVTDAAGRSLSTNSHMVAEGIGHLIAAFPSSSSLDECVGSVAGDKNGASELISDALYRMLLVGMITLSLEPVRAGRAGDRPEAIRLAREDAAEGRKSTTNLRHETVTLDPATLVLLPAMDGSLDRSALACRLAAEALSGRIAFSRDGKAVTESEEIGEVVEEHLTAILEGLANAALLEVVTDIS